MGKKNILKPFVLKFVVGIIPILGQKSKIERNKQTF